MCFAAYCRNDIAQANVTVSRHIFVCSFKLRQVFLLKCLTCEGLVNLFFWRCVLWVKTLSQRPLKARRRKRAGYSESAFGIWEDCLKTAVLGSFFPKSIENKLGVESEERQWRTALCLCWSTSMPLETVGLWSKLLFVRNCNQFGILWGCLWN